MTPWVQRLPIGLAELPRTALPSKTLPLSRFPIVLCPARGGQTYTVVSGSPNPFLSQEAFPCDSLKHLILSYSICFSEELDQHRLDALASSS